MIRKSRQLQIRLTPAQQAALKRLARRAGQDLSSYVLGRALPDPGGRFAVIVTSLRDAEQPSLALAALHDLLAGLSGPELAEAVASLPPEFSDLSPLLRNYVAAMMEQASRQREVPPPSWAGQVPPLDQPYFATSLRSLRMHLLRAAPVAFKRRNLFVDSTIGDRV